ncbi:MAG: hypothetical protein Q8J87_06430, partial [Sediminibacterium sp.]|nr:hypothetical protein [Sediminibacterium sp.]
MDEFKKYLVENQEQFNADEPSPLIWDKVYQRVKLEKVDATAKVFSMRKLVQWAAAACILGLAGIGLWYLFTDNNVVKPLQEQVVTNEEKPNSAPNNLNNATHSSTNNIDSAPQATDALVATESNAPSASATQPILSKTTQSVQSRTASSASPANNSN